MEYKIKIHKEAFNDIQNSIDWYDKQSNGLGLRFASQVIKQISMLRENGKHYPIRYNDVRCMIIKKFPFLVHYHIDEEADLITVFAVFHTSLNPMIWDKLR